MNRVMHSFVPLLPLFPFLLYLHRLARPFNQSGYAEDDNCANECRQYLLNQSTIAAKQVASNETAQNTQQNLDDQRERKPLEQEIS